MQGGSLKEEASGLILGSTLFAGLMLFAIGSSAAILEWSKPGMAGGGAESGC